MLINLFYCLTNGESEFIPDLRGISKHLMLLFNRPVFKRKDGKKRISKHLMLLFNKVPISIWNYKSYISKHLMLLFNESIPFKYASLLLFQNISCYCLTPVLLQDNVLLPIFQNISCYCLTSLL